MKPPKPIPPTKTPFGLWLEEQHTLSMKFKRVIDKSMAPTDRTKTIVCLTKVNDDLQAIQRSLLGVKPTTDKLKRIQKSQRRIDWLITCLLSEAVKTEEIKNEKTTT